MTMHYISHQHRKLVVPFRSDIAALLPHAKMFDYENAPHLSMPHGDDEVRLLRNLGIDLPTPIQEYYTWPGAAKPFIQQVKTAAMLTTNPQAFVLNQMGTGKTKAALWAFDWLRTQGKAHKMLVVAPLSTLRFVWAREAMLTLTSLKVNILDGTKERRLKRLAEEADIYIINHDGLVTMRNELLARRDIDVICFDECAAFRNARADRSKAAQQLTKGRAFVWGMTGSPTPTAPTDAFGLARLIIPQRCPSSFTGFRSEIMIPHGPFKWLPKIDAAQRVADLLQPSTCYTLEDTTELPQLIDRPFPVAQGGDQTKFYKQMADQMVALIKDGTITAANGGVAMSKLLQISSGWVYNDNGLVSTFDNSARLNTLVELIDGARAKVIVFAPFIHTVTGIENHLKKERLDYARVTGDTSPGERDRIFRAFQNTDEYDVLLAHPQCMAHGLTLTAADTIIWFSPITSLEIFDQANARITRVGQTRKQQVFMLHGTAAERRVYAQLRNKQATQTGILDLLKESLLEAA